MWVLGERVWVIRPLAYIHTLLAPGTFLDSLCPAAAQSSLAFQVRAAVLREPAQGRRRRRTIRGHADA
jgi:hypothetical protein